MAKKGKKQSDKKESKPVESDLLDRVIDVLKSAFDQNGTSISVGARQLHALKEEAELLSKRDLGDIVDIDEVLEAENEEAELNDEIDDDEDEEDEDDDFNDDDEY